MYVCVCVFLCELMPCVFGCLQRSDLLELQTVERCLARVLGDNTGPLGKQKGSLPAGPHSSP